MSDTETGLIMASIFYCGVLLSGIAIALAVAFTPLPPIMLETPPPPKINPGWIGLDR